MLLLLLITDHHFIWTSYWNQSSRLCSLRNWGVLLERTKEIDIRSEVTGSSCVNRLFQTYRRRLHTINPKWPDPSPDLIWEIYALGLPFKGNQHKKKKKNRNTICSEVFMASNRRLSVTINLLLQLMLRIKFFM